MRKWSGFSRCFPNFASGSRCRGGLCPADRNRGWRFGQALIGRPQFLLVDELSFGLAPTVVRRLATAVEAIAAAGVGVLLIEQFTTLTLGMARGAYLLERGRVVFAGDSARLRERPELLHSAYLAADHGEAEGPSC